MENAYCEGGFNISVDPGFWWRNSTTTNIYQCLKKSACLGGFYPEKEPPVECLKGYEGILCTRCS